MTLTTRPATVDDAAMIGDLITRIDDYPHWQAVGAPTMAQNARAAIEAVHPNRSVLVAEIDGRVVGYASAYWLDVLFSGRECYVSELFVRSDASGKGAGSALLAAIEAEGLAQGCGRMTLVNIKDRESYKRGFYASRGWTEKPNTVRFARDISQK